MSQDTSLSQSPCRMRIGHISFVKMYGGQYDYAPYTLTITIDDYKIANMLIEEKEKRDSLDRIRQEQKENRERERLEKLSRTL